MTVFTYGVFDLFHYGHIRALLRAKRLGKELIIGVFSDRVAESFKRKPIINQEERQKLIKSLGLGWTVILDDLEPTQEFLNDNNIRIVAKGEGAGWTKERQPRWAGIKSVLLPYTEWISTSEIINRIKWL